MWKDAEENLTRKHSGWCGDTDVRDAGADESEDANENQDQSRQRCITMEMIKIIGMSRYWHVEM